MLSGREQELAGRLREAASQGDTSLVLTLLEDGAPFVVDSDGQTAFTKRPALDMARLWLLSYLVDVTCPCKILRGTRLFNGQPPRATWTS